MLFSSIGREGIGLKDTLARAVRRGKSKKFMEAIRCLILQVEPDFQPGRSPDAGWPGTLRLQLVNLPVDNSGARAVNIYSSC